MLLKPLALVGNHDATFQQQGAKLVYRSSSIDDQACAGSVQDLHLEMRFTFKVSRPRLNLSRR